MALRTSLIWHDEVMSDVVSERPVPITIGPQEGTTFTTPDIGFVDAFAIVRPRRRGYLLVLGGGMRGTVCVEGVEHDVASLIAASETPGAYATPITGLDWGVIELDASGKLKLFFQFCGVDDVPAAPLFEQQLERRASFAFSTLVHAALLVTAYKIYFHHDEMIAASRDLTAQYTPSRLEVFARAGAAMTAPQQAEPTVGTVKTTVAPPTRMTPAPPPIFAPPPRIKRLPPTVQPPAPPPEPGFIGNVHIDNMLKPNKGINGLVGVDGGGGGGGGPGGNGPGGELPTTHGIGDEGGGGGRKPGPVGGPGFKTTDPLNVGNDRKAVGLCTGPTCGGGETEITPNNPTTDHDDDTITAVEIQRVMEHSKALLLGCYQKAINHNDSLAGTVTVRFEITPAGKVSAAKVKHSTLADDGVTQCLTQRLSVLAFPDHAGSAVVNYPFVFSAH